MSDTPTCRDWSGLVEGHGVDQAATVHGQVVVVGPKESHYAAVLIQLLVRASKQVDAWRIGARVDGKETLTSFSAFSRTRLRQQNGFHFQTHIMVFVILAKPFKNVCISECL